MEQLNAYELTALLKFYVNEYPPHVRMAERILEIATALKARALEAAK